MNIPANDYSQTIRLQRPNQKHGFHFMRFLIGPLHSCLLVSAGVPCALCCIAPITWRPLPTNAPDEGQPVSSKRGMGAVYYASKGSTPYKKEPRPSLLPGVLPTSAPHLS